MKNLISAEPKTLPSTMRYVAHGEGGGPQVLQLAEGSVPAPGPREVLIEVAFAGVNGPDVQQRSGHYPPPPGASAVLGLEVAGRGARRRSHAMEHRRRGLRADARRRLRRILRD